MRNFLIFDIETIPDTNSGQRLYHLNNLPPSEVAHAMFKMRREATGGSDFLRLHLQRIVAISCVLARGNHLKVWSLGDVSSSEEELLARFFKGINEYRPILVSWNGGGFDLPVIHYRALLHGVCAPLYWEIGDCDKEFRWNNYLGRYHYRHMDLMDILAAYQPRANAPLDEIAVMLGFPGKMGMNGNQVWEYFQRGEIDAIRNYCETDVLNTYLVFLRFELIRGKLTESEYLNACQNVRDLLRKESKPHFDEFLDAWKE
jgi:3'-5' exonuclease